MWSNTALSAKIFFFSASAFFPLMVTLLHWSKATLIIGLIGVAFFIVLERFRYTPTIFMRALFMYFGGPLRRSGKSHVHHALNKRKEYK